MMKEEKEKCKHNWIRDKRKVPEYCLICGISFKEAVENSEGFKNIFRKIEEEKEADST